MNQGSELASRFVGRYIYHFVSDWRSWNNWLAGALQVYGKFKVNNFVEHVFPIPVTLLDQSLFFQFHKPLFFRSCNQKGISIHFSELTQDRKYLRQKQERKQKQLTISSLARKCITEICILCERVNC